MNKQKIIHVIYNLKTGGAEKLLIDTLIECKNKNLQIELLVLNKNEVDSFLEQKLTDASIPIHYFIKTYSKYSFNLFFALHKKIKTIKPDIIHVHLFPSLYYLAIWNYFSNNQSFLIYTEHSTNNRRRKIIGIQFIETWVYKQYSSIICISDGVKKSLLEHIHTMNSKIIPNGVNLSSLIESKNINIPEILNKLNSENKTILLAIGRLVTEKNHVFLLELFEILPSNMVLLICGEGKERYKLEKQIKEKSLQKRVYLLGNQQNLAGIITNSKVGIMPSLYEGFGLAAIEMMALGLPVFLHNISGLNELTTTNELLFSINEKEQLKEKIIRLSSDKKLYEQYSKLASIKAEEYSIEKMVSSYIELYQSKK